jgi:hypothetical protein|tara:strand:+ start:1506 stop:2174 length:669 start_codon:yes stop_codon:yes gene_type:complete
MLTETQANTMLSLQASMNFKIDPDWVEARYPYLLAVVIEGAEAIEHHGWKWWKKQHKDLPQLQMELIDIWHFMLSEILLRNDADEEKAVMFLNQAIADSEHLQSLSFDGQDYPLKELGLLQQIELLIALAGARRVEVGLFSSIMRLCELDWNGLFSQYVGKNVLNVFRQDHGYKQGTYLKQWNGQEDNEHLVEILNQLDPEIESYKEQLYSQLESRYPGEAA